jgi:hypothetical protein
LPESKNQAQPAGRIFFVIRKALLMSWIRLLQPFGTRSGSLKYKFLQGVKVLFEAIYLLRAR